MNSRLRDLDNYRWRMSEAVNIDPSALSSTLDKLEEELVKTSRRFDENETEIKNSIEDDRSESNLHVSYRNDAESVLDAKCLIKFFNDEVLLSTGTTQSNKSVTVTKFGILPERKGEDSGSIRANDLGRGPLLQVVFAKRSKRFAEQTGEMGIQCGRPCPRRQVSRVHLAGS